MNTDSAPVNDQDAAPTSSRPWRDDPLSVFLLVSALFLALMYGVESRLSQSVKTQDERAWQMGVHEGYVDLGCALGAAGARGEVLVIACKTLAIASVEAATREKLGKSADATGFERVVLRGAAASMLCTREAKGGLGTCAKLEADTQTQALAAQMVAL
ncbi:MAG: hypothetical protein H0U74_02935 [Bradymonadaceae bacterium]|nr:hypothetical protein [Lujinxingiaceae bacterium]